jgi:hypothetical protein
VFKRYVKTYQLTIRTLPKRENHLLLHHFFERSLPMMHFKTSSRQIFKNVSVVDPEKNLTNFTDFLTTKLQTVFKKG